ncbi:MAG: nucleotidyltransferase [Vallitalea sp.]|jgi:predicted nucleotidyltransferase|nr:nucleotidyltransferase [Vallitalea sp.]
MSVVGIVAEYNPFHNGHKFQLEQAKKITKSKYCVVVMSGNFVQRGEPAIVDKWIRTEMALKNGADLVIELPVHFSTSSAEFFSHASVKLLNDIGIIDNLCFGSELGETSVLGEIASVLCNEPKKYKNILTSYLKEGNSFATARSNALTDYLINDKILAMCKDELTSIIKSPNNILGIEYMKALLNLDSRIKPYSIKRIGSSYHGNDINTLSSATAIRKALRNSTKELESLENCMPASSYELLEKAIKANIAPIFFDDYSALINYKLKILSPDQMENCLNVSEGIQNRFKKAVINYCTISDIIGYTRTRRYPISRIQRTLLHIMLSLDKDNFWKFVDNGFVQYVKILGFRKDSRDLLKLLKERSILPIISNVKDSFLSLNELQKKMLEDEIKCSDIYNIIIGNKYGRTSKNDYTHPIVRI